MKKYSIAIVDDHLLFAQSLQTLVSSFDNYEVIFHAANGKDFIEVLNSNGHVPDIVLLDINMPIMDGVETMGWLKENMPELKVIALSMDDTEDTIIKMLRFGAKGYLLKDIHPNIFKQALSDVVEKGFYFSDRITNTLLDTLDKKESEKDQIYLKDREVEFLKYACSEMTYKEIANEMCLSPKTIDGYRESLFEKLQVKSRIGLVLYAIKHELIEMNDE
ncbi:two component transcriptional regulator, LuxR family [Zhouia amylolytica]|uniref:Response regulator containing a CheY-like receiver domain and an HTH DNA-binding domain protein n=2 Tax=Zhouia amylolytica TaxID=376730 RepID=W2UNU9_9FLAO|nr:response regulator transcription factor [Zhouia amylolytica]ETN95678.1 response regulator containing a CheY-like receiver domain and an HTH DNA-binding domain protein [Zhouia amylolytica AD3]MCQ0113078.1 response regulator transcription factor [Zhouia amylolytica]SFS56697.1 two component transcriptional regulator, LuxR family [Zhouia amylolytica]